MGRRTDPISYYKDMYPTGHSLLSLLRAAAARVATVLTPLCHLLTSGQLHTLSLPACPPHSCIGCLHQFKTASETHPCSNLPLLSYWSSVPGLEHPWNLSSVITPGAKPSTIWRAPLQSVKTHCSVHGGERHLGAHRGGRLDAQWGMVYVGVF